MSSVTSEVTAKARKKAKPVSQKGRSLYYFYLIPGLIAFLTVIGGSFFWNIYLSFTKWNGLGKPKWVGFQNYEKLMADETFWASFIHAFYFIAAMSIIPTFLGVFIAALLLITLLRGSVIEAQHLCEPASICRKLFRSQ